jgi:hypothetical protein
MFSFLNRKIHEHEAIQIADVRNTALGTIAISRVNFDVLPNGFGSYGKSFNNPIRVNRSLGTYKYFSKLLSLGDEPVYFHRLESLDTGVTDNPIDAYEMATWIGNLCDIIFIDIYHPRRSNLAPKGYKLRSYKDNPLGDVALAFGIDIFCPIFPFDLHSAISMRNNFTALARQAQERVSAGSYERPEQHRMNVLSIRSRIQHFNH